MTDYLQNYQRLYEYIHEYQSLVYDIYSKHAPRFLITYYNINRETTIWEDEYVFGGSYERIGELTGTRWDKYLLLPIYWTDEVATAFSGEDIGYIKEGETYITFPNTYNITPYPGDLVKLEQEYLRPVNDVYPLFIVTNAEISANTDRRYWKLKIEVRESETTTNADEQVSRILAFFEYTKKIYEVSDAAFLTKMLTKNETLRGRLRSLFDENSGFYFVGDGANPGDC